MMNSKNLIKLTGFAIFTALTIFFMGCEEEPPFIDTTPRKNILKDTTYITTNLPPAQDKVVVVEDISGVNCVNCPAAAVKAEALKDANPTRVAVVTLLPTKNILGTFTDPKGIYADLGTPKVDQLISFTSIPSGLPSGMINRHDNGNGITMPYQLWDNPMAIELAKSTVVNIDLSSSYNDANRELIISSNVIYTANHSDSLQDLTIMLVESDIIGKQKDRTGDVPDYVFKHVLRDFATNAVGDPLNAKIEEGRVFEKQFSLTLDPSWDISNCEIIAMVHSRSDKTIYQAAFKKAKN